MADRLAEDGWKELGYEYVIIDDCWMSMLRDEQGRLQPDPSRLVYFTHFADLACLCSVNIHYCAIICLESTVVETFTLIHLNYSDNHLNKQFCFQNSPTVCTVDLVNKSMFTSQFSFKGRSDSCQLSQNHIYWLLFNGNALGTNSSMSLQCFSPLYCNNNLRSEEVSSSSNSQKKIKRTVWRNNLFSKCFFPAFLSYQAQNILYMFA